MNERLPESIPKGLRLVHNFEPGRPGSRDRRRGLPGLVEKADASRALPVPLRLAPHLKHYDSDAHGRSGMEASDEDFRARP